MSTIAVGSSTAVEISDIDAGTRIAIDCLAPDVRAEFESLTPREQLTVLHDVEEKSKSTGVAYLMLLVGGWHYLYLGQTKRFWKYFFTLGGLGVWALIDLFKMRSRVRVANAEIAARQIARARVPGA